MIKLERRTAEWCADCEEPITPGAMIFIGCIDIVPRDVGKWPSSTLCEECFVSSRKYFMAFQPAFFDGYTDAAAEALTCPRSAPLLELLL